MFWILFFTILILSLLNKDVRIFKFSRQWVGSFITDQLKICDDVFNIDNTVAAQEKKKKRKGQVWHRTWHKTKDSVNVFAKIFTFRGITQSGFVQKY